MHGRLTIHAAASKPLPIDKHLIKQAPHAMAKADTPALIALAFTILIWGVTGVFARGISLALGPHDALVVRLMLVAIVFFVVLIFTSGFRMGLMDAVMLAAISLIGLFGYFVFAIFGFAYAPAGIGTLIMSTQPMLIAMLASFVGSEKLSIQIIIGLLISFGGSILLVWGNGFGDGTAAGFEIARGCGLIFIGGVAWSIFVVFSKSLIQSYGAIKITGLSNIIIALPLLPLVNTSLITKTMNLNTDAIFGLVFLSTLGATASVVTWNYAAGKLQPSLLGSSLYIMPIIAVFAGWAILSEPITSNVIIAAAIILAGVAISQVKSRARRQESAS
jgi:drug/metabolite transporter (DMT)-like permease